MACLQAMQVALDYASLLAQAPDPDHPGLADELLKQVQPTDREPLDAQVQPIIGRVPDLAVLQAASDVLWH